jgi:2-polyprenyl-3-methyl-5-hydroxy-6-metoxy-1,4-benzoquinol methylase
MVADAFIQTHDFPCWCGEKRNTLVCQQLFGRRHFVVLACLACGTHRILPRALQSEASADALYNEYDQPGVRPQEEAAFIEHMFKRLKNVGLSFKTGQRVLDVGCGNGALLDAICRRFDCSGKGIDVDRRRIETARARGGPAKFECGLFDSARADADGPYDAVISSAVIEHVIDPVSFIALLGRALAPGGSLFLLSPNAASLNYRLLKSWWRELLSIGEHIYLFTPGSLADCAVKSNFRLVADASDFDWGFPSFRFNSPRTAAISAWALYCQMIKRLSHALASSKTGDILFAHFKKG